MVTASSSSEFPGEFEDILPSVLELDSILEDACPEENEVAKMRKSTPRQKTEPLEVFSASVLEKVLLELMSDGIIHSDSKAKLKKIVVGELAPRLGWINNCLTDKWHLLPVSREKVWSSYHQSLMANLTEITTVTECRQLSSIICLHTMKHLIQANYTPPSSSTPTISVNLSARDQDILEYVSGFILRKLKHTMMTQHLEITDQAASGLIGTKNRGGLIQPHKDFVKVVEEMEKVFRQLPEQSVNKDLFCNILCKGDIPSMFFELFEQTSFTSEAIDHVFVDFCNIFFTVRSHHKCRTLVEENIRKTKIKRKSKALRDSI